MNRPRGFLFLFVLLQYTRVRGQLSDEAYSKTVEPIQYKDPEGTERSLREIENSESVWNFGPIGDVLLILLIVAILVLILYFIVSKLKNSKSNKKIDQSLEFTEENLDSVNSSEIDLQLEDAVNKKRYNQAVRFLFLRNLKALNEKSLIYWAKHKTNYIYRNELPLDFQKAFSDLSIRFELARYSRHRIDAVEFQSTAKMMSDFYHQIQRYEQK